MKSFLITIVWASFKSGLKDSNFHLLSIDARIYDKCIHIFFLSQLQINIVFSKNGLKKKIHNYAFYKTNNEKYT